MSAATIRTGDPLAIAPPLDQAVDEAGIGQCRCIAKRAVIVLGDLPEDPAHDLARPGLGERGGEMQHIRSRDRADLLADMAAQLRLQALVRLLSGDQSDVAI